MRPASQVEVKCWLCDMTFKNRRQLKNHLAAAPHKRLSLICVWCSDEKSYRRMVDLKEHIWASHRSRIEMMPSNFLTENNGFWMANYPETYAQVIQPSNENSVEAMKARIEVLEFIQRVGKTVRTKEQWIQGWKCPKRLVSEEETEQEPPKRAYSPSRPNVYEDMELQKLTIGLGTSIAIFRLDLGVTVRDYEVTMMDEVLKEPKMLDALIRRMTALMNSSYIETRTFNIPIEDDLKKMISKVMARKLSIREDLIKEIKTTEELFPAKRPRMSTIKPLSPLQTPSTSDIVLEEDVGHENEKEKEKTKEHGGKKKKIDNQKQPEEEKHKERKHTRKEAEITGKGDASNAEERNRKDVEMMKEDERIRMEEEKREQEESRRQAETRKQEEEKLRKEEETKRLEEERKKQEERRRQAEEKRMLEKEKLRKEEERKRIEEERKQQENMRKQAEEARKLEDDKLRKEEERKRMEEERKKQEEMRRQAEETRKQEEKLRMAEEHERQEERRRQVEEIMKEKQKLMEETKKLEKECQQLEEKRKQAEKERKEEMVIQEEDRQDKDEETRTEQEEQQEQDTMMPEEQERQIIMGNPKTPRDRAINLLRKGGMPLFPAGRREWNEEEVITLMSLPTNIKWPPKNWKSMTPDQKYFNWEFASMALELPRGIPTQLTKEELLIKYNFLALPGSKTPTVEEEKTNQIKSRFYIYSVLKQIIKSNMNDINTIQFLTMLEAAVLKKDNSLDEICERIDSVGVGLRLGDEL